MPILYFPNVKVAKCDLVPHANVSLTYLLHLKSQLKSPKHYPDHPLIEGKVEFVGKITDNDTFKFWFSYIFNESNHKKLKGLNLSVLVNFDPDNINSKFTLLGIGKKQDVAYLFSNRTLEVSPEEMKAKLNYDLNKKDMKDKPKIKI